MHMSNACTNDLRRKKSQLEKLKAELTDKRCTLMAAAHVPAHLLVIDPKPTPPQHRHIQTYVYL